MLIFTSLGHFTNDSTSMLFPVLITYYVLLPNVSILFLGSSAIILNVISGLISTPIGSLADRTDHDALLIAAGIVILGVSGFILALPFRFESLTFPLTLAGAALLGLGQAFYHPLGASLLSYTYGKDAPPAMGINGSMGSLGRAITPAVLVFTMESLGKSFGVSIYAFYLVLAGILIAVFLGRIRRTAVESGTNRVKMAEPSQQPAVNGASKYLGLVYLLTAAVFIRSLFLTGTSTFIPTLLKGVYHSETLMSLVVTIGLITPIFGQPLFGRMTSSRGGRYSIIFTFILSTVAFGAFLLFVSNLYLTIVTYALYAFAAYSGFPVFLGYVGQIVPKELAGKSNGLVWGLGSTFGGAVGIAVITGLTLFISIPTAIDLMFVFAVLSLVFLPLFPKRGQLSRRATAS